MLDFTIQSYFYNKTSALLRNDIVKLLNSVWPDISQLGCSEDKIPITHIPELSAQSFCCYADNTLIGYAGVVQKVIYHCGHSFRIAGLSCVATMPYYRGRGIGSAIVKEATKWIETQNDIDFGIFTCDAGLAEFYSKSGGWNISPNTILLGSREKGALSSETLDVVVLMHIFSVKAKKYEIFLHREPISLDFPLGEFL